MTHNHHHRTHALAGLAVVLAIAAAVHYAFGERAARALVAVVLLGFGGTGAAFFLYVMYRIVTGTI